MPDRLLRNCGITFTDPEVMATIHREDLRRVGSFNARGMEEESIRHKVAKLGGDYYYPLREGSPTIIAYKYTRPKS